MALRKDGALECERGGVLGVALHVVLLAVVLGELLFLAGRTRWRFDATSERQFSLTDSTRELLQRLEEPLLIEAYFGPAATLPGNYREGRVVLDNFLEELQTVAGGKLLLERFDPTSDKDIEDTCVRLGIRPLDLPSRSSTSASVNRNWQGLRLRYGGQRQKVLPVVQPSSTFGLEALITPAIKEVMTVGKRRIGYMEWPMEPLGGQGGAYGFSQVRDQELVASRYEFVDVKDVGGGLVPAEIDTVILFRPKELTDRQKYVVDQFLMRGGNLVGFVDAVDYEIGRHRSFNRRPLEFDARGGKERFLDQLLRYGVELRPKVVADMFPQAHQAAANAPLEKLALVVQNQVAPVAYPYFMHAVAADWRNTAEQLAKGDAQMAEQLRKLLHPGIDSGEFLFQPFLNAGRGPGFYWPCWVDLRRSAGEPNLPAGVTGRVLLWSSPLSIVDEPPQNLNPIEGADLQTRSLRHRAFIERLNTRLKSEPTGQQAPLMVELKGTFPSHFAGRERPLTAAEVKEKELRDAEERRRKEAGQDPLQEPGKQGDGQQGKENATPDAQGPPVPTTEQPTPAAAEPPALAAATAPGRLVLVADADFVRDDIVYGVHRQDGGPVSIGYAPHFFAGLLDWLADDRDLIELQSRVVTDRTMRFAVQDPTGETPADFERRLEQRMLWLRLVNVVAPVLVLLAIGAVVLLRRAMQRRSFLARVQG